MSDTGARLAKHRAWMLDYYERNHQGGEPTVRSALGDAAGICDAVAADLLEEHRIRGRVTKHGKALAAAVTDAGNAIWEVRGKIKS